MKTKMELIAEMTNHSGMTPTMIHVAMSVMFRRTRKELSGMHGMGVGACLDAMKKANVLKNPKHGQWTLNEDRSTWQPIAENSGKKDEKKNSAKLVKDVGLSSEIFALEQMLNELKSRVNQNETA